MRPLLPFVLALFTVAGCNSTPLPDACYLKPESGKCRASIMRWSFDKGAGTCKAFVWGGCDGVVPFETLESCHAQCMPGQPLPEVTGLKKAPPASSATPAVATPEPAVTP